MASFPANVVSVIVDPSGTPETLVCRLLHFSKVIGARPSEFQVLLLNKKPGEIATASYQGKAAIIKVDGTTKLTGNIMRIEKQFAGQNVIFTVQDHRWKMNATYVGATLLDTLDTDPDSATYGTPTTFNGLPWYGADLTFNLNGLPNKSKTSLDFVPPGYEHSVAFADFWTYGQAVEYLWALQSAVAMPSNGGLSPADWTFGGMDRKMEEAALFGKPVAEAIEAVVNRTRCQWFLDATNTPVFFSVDNPNGTYALNIGDPVTPVTATDHSPIEFNVEISVDDSIGQLDIIGGKQQREVLLGSTYTGSIYNGTEVQTATDFEKVTWFGIETSGGWNVPGLTWVGSPFDLKWTNYSVERYQHTYTAALIAGETFQEHVNRFNLKGSVYEAHKIGKNLTGNYQPYKMLSQLLLARDKNGQYVNPSDPTALEGVSPLELLKTQYPDGCSADLDRMYLIARGGSPWVVSPLFLMQPPWYSEDNPTKMTAAFECAGRAYVSATTAITGMPTQVRRCVIRDEFIHQTCEATQVVMPMVLDFDAVGNWTVIEGVAVPSGWSRNYATSGNIYAGGPVRQQDLTLTRPAGVIVDAMGELTEIKDVVSDYVGLKMVNGSGALATWQNLELGMQVTGAASQFDTTDLELVTALSFSDETQRLDFAFCNRMGIDVASLARGFVNRLAYIRPL